MLDQLADQMARECQEHICKSLQMMGSLVSTAVTDVRELGAEMEKFLVGPSFEEIWNSYQTQPLSPMEYLGEIFVAGSGHETNEFYEGELQTLSPAKVITKDSALSLLSYIQAGTVRVLMEINSNHKPVFEGLFQQSLEFVNFAASMVETHDKTFKKLARWDANAMFNRVSRRTLTPEGLRIVESFLACSDTFHQELRETIKQVVDDAARQYNQSANHIRKKLETNQAHLKRQQDTLGQLIQDLKNTETILPADWPKICRTLQQSHEHILGTVLLLIEESPKVIKGSFELVEYAIESVCTVLRKIKDVADQKGYSGSEKTNSESRETNFKLVKVPEEAMEIVMQNTLSKSFVESRTLKIVPSLEGDKIQKMVIALLNDWYEHCASVLAPIGSKMVRTEVQNIPAAIVNMLPTFQSNELLQLVKVCQAKLSVKSIPTQVSIGLSPGLMIATGNAINASVLLAVPASLILSWKDISNFLGSTNGLAILTTKGEISLYFKETADRELVRSWVTENNKKTRTANFQSVLSQYCHVVSVEGQAGELDLCQEHLPLLKARELRCKQALFWLGTPGNKSFSRKTAFPLCSIYRVLALMAGRVEVGIPLPGALVEEVVTKYSSKTNPKNQYRVTSLPAFLLPLSGPVSAFWQGFLRYPDTVFHSFSVMDNNLLLDIIEIQILFATVDTIYLVMSSEQKRHSPRFFQLHQNGPDTEVWEPEPSDEASETDDLRDWVGLVKAALQPPADLSEGGEQQPAPAL